MDYTKIEVGKPLEGVQGREDGCVFDISDAGAVLYIYYNSPTPAEVKDFSAGSPLEVRYVVLGGELYLLFKFGGQDWMDVPYNPHLSRGLTKLELPQGGTEGLSLTVILADTSDGTVKVLRLVGLGNRFSKSLVGAILERAQKPFDPSAYNASIASVYGRYDTKQMLKFSVERFRIGQ